MEQSIWTIASLKIEEKFTLEKDTSNGCIYIKISPIDIKGVICNCARCWKDQSELVRYPNDTRIMRICE